MLLEGRVCVVSGAASKRGLGLATARLFARHGAHVAILDLDIEASREAVIWLFAAMSPTGASASPP